MFNGISSSYKGFKVPLSRVARQPEQGQSELSSNFALSNSRNFAYLVSIGIGGQNLSVILDTGSSDLWVVSSGCNDTDCQNVTKYSPTTSLSLTNVLFTLKYLVGSVSGTVGFESVSLGPYRISPQVFALANQTVGLGLTSTGHSGILGLSFPSEASIPSTSGQPFIKNLGSYFPDDQRYFAVKLSRDQSTSSFTFGELDPLFANSTDEFNWTPVYKSEESGYDYWKLSLRGITVNGTSLTALSSSKLSGSNTPIAVLDSGTTLILGPASDVQYFWESIGGTKKDDAGLWRVRCNRGVIVRFALGSQDDAKEYVIDPQDVSWMDGGTQGEWCMGGIQANDNVNSGDWLLGDVFLRNVYVTHQLETQSSPPQIGLLSTTNADQAMALFLSSRGGDSTSAGIQLVNNLHTKPQASPGLVYATPILCGFVIGAICTHFLLLRQAKLQERKRAR